MEHTKKEEQIKQDNAIILGFLILVFLLAIAYFTDKVKISSSAASFGAKRDYKIELFSFETQRRIKTSFAKIFLTDFRNDPTLIHSLSPDEFEDFVALVLINKGYDVELTPKSKDGGKDIIAKFEMPTGNTIVSYVECKKYKVDKKVGVQYVRALYGTINTDRINAGIFVTTSSFTKGARDFQAANGHFLYLADINDLTNWLGA